MPPNDPDAARAADHLARLFLEARAAGDTPQRIAAVASAVLHLAGRDPAGAAALRAADSDGLGETRARLVELIGELGPRLDADEAGMLRASVLGAVRGALDAVFAGEVEALRAEALLRRQVQGLVRATCQPPAPRDLPPSAAVGAAAAAPPTSDIHEFVDYRAWLRDWLARPGSPSQRTLAARVGISPAMLSGVLAADRDLSAFKAEQLAEAVTQDPRERQYFLDMVEYNQPGPLARRTAAFDRMTALRTFRGAQNLTAVDRAWMMFRHWYVPAINELVACDDFVEDPAWIAARLRPEISPQQAADALAALEEGGGLVRDERGRLVQSARLLATDHEVARVAGLAVGAWHLWLLERAAVVLDTLPASERYFGSLCMALSDETLVALRDRTKRFSEEAGSLAASSKHPRRVYQLSFQLMPLSERLGEPVTG